MQEVQTIDGFRTINMQTVAWEEWKINQSNLHLIKEIENLITASWIFYYFACLLFRFLISSCLHKLSSNYVIWVMPQMRNIESTALFTPKNG